VTIYIKTSLPHIRAVLLFANFEQVLASPLRQTSKIETVGCNRKIVDRLKPHSKYMQGDVQLRNIVPVDYVYTVRKMGLILRPIARMLKMQFFMARNFTLQPLRRYDVKPPEIKRDDFFGANMNNFRFYTEHTGEV
jgi:hypothetical protein